MKRNRPVKATALTIAIAVTLGGGGAVAAAEISGPSGVRAGQPDPPGSAESPSFEVSIDNFKQTGAVLLASGFKADGAFRVDSNCAEHSYDQVHYFFVSDPCKWVARAYIGVHPTSQALAVVAISWVEMPNVSQAQEYKHLVDRSRTGNITELSRDEGPYRNVIFNGDYYMSGIVGTAVWNVQVQPVSAVSITVTKRILAKSRQ